MCWTVLKNASLSPSWEMQSVTLLGRPPATTPDLPCRHWWLLVEVPEVIRAVAFPPQFRGVFSFQEMGDKRCFNVGYKSFEMIMDDDGKGMRIIERARNNMSSITLGRDGAHWLQLGMVDLILRSPDQGFVRTQREQGKVYVPWKNRNNRGRFISVTEFGTVCCMWKMERKFIIYFYIVILLKHYGL